MSDGLAKACGLGKMYSVEENISHFSERMAGLVIKHAWTTPWSLVAMSQKHWVIAHMLFDRVYVYA